MGIDLARIHPLAIGQRMEVQKVQENSMYLSMHELMAGLNSPNEGGRRVTSYRVDGDYEKRYNLYVLFSVNFINLFFSMMEF